MGPKVYGKLLTTQRKGLGDDVEALHGRFPLRWSAGEGSKMGSRRYRRLRRWKIVFCGAPRWFQGTWVYIGGRSRSMDARGAHEGGGAPTCRGRAGHPRGLLLCCLTSTPSPLDHVCSKKIAPEGFIPFVLHLIFLSFETLK